MLAATEPVPPAVLAQLVELPTARVEELCDELAAGVRARGARVPAGAGRRWLPLPDPSRRVPVRRAVRARRPDRAAVGPRARDARDHRLQAADRPGAALGDPGCQRRRDAEDARRARLRRRDRSRADAGQPVAVRHDRTCSSNGSVSTRSTSFPRSPTSFPTRRSSRRSNGACASPASTHDDPEPAELAAELQSGIGDD